ncbi:hypothetical protein [Streptomyces brasiliensis]|uniref:Uncharacterized protein n=1 Tax=Streptomyces brasiliensis TaxID=1954 RepID=A0A917PA04_9ACTN|nr:hypothetical protein [Streptomyces brasiliensis]GGJ67912.1 hypothetical protein GCM10010121_093240 [Streptomyces brasiliensis]
MRILAPGFVPVPASDDVAPDIAAAPNGVGEETELASVGYHRGLAAHREAAPPWLANPGIAQAVDSPG